MQPIIFPLRENDSGPQVANLQEALRALYLQEGKVFKTFDSPNHPTKDELKSLIELLRAEQIQQKFGDATFKLVSYFQTQQGLGDHLKSEVEQTTAAKLNELLKSYDLLNDLIAPVEFVVEGVVTRPGSDGKKGAAVTGVTVQAFDQDVAKATLLGQAVTDAEGKYHITFTEKRYIEGDFGYTTPDGLAPMFRQISYVALPKVIKSGPDLWVAIPGEGDTYRAKSDIIFNAGIHTNIDLTAPEPVVQRDSEFEEVARMIVPRLVSVTLENLTEKQIDFLSKDAERPLEHIAALAAAARMNAEAKQLATRQNIAIGDLEPVLFAGSYAFLRVQPGFDFEALLNQGQTWWSDTLDDALRQNRIPKTVSLEKEKLIELLNHLRALRTLEPAKEKTPASLGDLFNTLDANWLTQEIRQKTARVIQEVPVESGEFMPRLKEVIPDEAQRNTVRRTLRLGELTSKHAPMVAALQPIAKETGDDGLHALAAVPTDRWLDLAYTHGAPATSFLTPEQYALQLEEAVEAQIPTAVLAHKLQTHPFFIQTPEYSALTPVLQKHPHFDITSGDVEAFAKAADLPPEQESSIHKLQHLKRMGARWEEAGTLLEKGVDSFAAVADTDKQQFIMQMKDGLDEARASAIHDNATAIRAASIGVMGYLQPLLFGVGSAVMQSFDNKRKKDDKVSEVIDSSPTLRKLFGALEQCACDPCLSVLSPAAYLADLLKFIDASPISGQESMAGQVLRQRRPDIYDLELSCDNSKIELPQIDLAIEILESAVAFPFSIPLPPRTDIMAELTASPVGNVIRTSLQKTATEQLGDLAAEQHGDLLAQQGEWRSTTWVVTDRYRRWTLDVSSETLGLKAGNGGEKTVSFDMQNVVNTDPVPELNNGDIPAGIEDQVINALEDGVIVKLPITAVVTGILPIVSSSQSKTKKWEISFSAAGWIVIEFGNPGNTGTLTMADSGDGKLSTRNYSNKLLTAIKDDLNKGEISPLIVRVLSEGTMNTKAAAMGFIVTAGGYRDSWNFTYSGKRTIVYRPSWIEITGLSYQSTPTDRDLFARPQNRNPLAYQKLSEERTCFPWSLPYDHNLAETRETLRAAGISRLELLETSSSRQTHYSSGEIAQERLGLSSAEWKLITTSKNEPEIWGVWGLQITSADQKTGLRDSFIEEEVNRRPLDDEDDKDHRGLLNRVSIVLQQARLTFAELQELLKTKYVNPDQTVRVSPDHVCQPSELKLNAVDVGFLDRLHRFVRLWRATGWAIWEVDRAVMSPAIGNGTIGEKTLTGIANLILLKERLGLSVEMLVAMFGGFWEERYTHTKDGRVREIVPLYERLFQDRRLVDPPDPKLAFSKDVNEKELPADKKALIAAALGIRFSDLEKLLEKSKIDPLDPVDPANPRDVIAFHSLCWAFRNVVLAKALKLSVEDYDRAWRLTDRKLTSSPFASPGALLEFLDEIAFVVKSGFTWSELEYILQGTSGDDYDKGLSTVAAAEILRGLQQELQQPPVSGEGVGDIRFGLNKEDLKQPPFSGLPGSDGERWEKRWRLTPPVSPSTKWSVADPKNPRSPVEDAPLTLLSRIDILAQQAKQSTKIIKDAIQTSFVNPAGDPARVITITGVAGSETIQNLSASHLDRLERFLALLTLTRLSISELVVRLQTFSQTGTEPLQWDLTKLVEACTSILTLQNLLRLKVEAIVAWWSDTTAPRETELIEALKLSKNEFARLRQIFETDYLLPAKTSIWDRPSTLLQFVQGVSPLKLRLEKIVQHLAQAISIVPDLAEILLWERLFTNDASPQPAIHTFAATDFGVFVAGFTDATLKKSTCYEILLRLHKIALLNARWQASPDELRWLPKHRDSKDTFAGLAPDDLPTPKKRDAVDITDWRRSATLFRLAHSDAAVSQMLVAYIKSFQSPAAGQPSEEAREKLKALFGFPPNSKTVDIAAKMLGITKDKHHLDPLRLSELVQLLGLLQRLGINEKTLNALLDNTSENLSANLGRMLLRPRFGESGWQQALKEVSNALRIQQRDRLVDFLLAREGLRDANKLYEHYLIDVQMSPCMNTSRLLQSTAAAQLFVHRCLFNLERKHGVLPESINRQRWEWMQNYRVWEANRKVFLYPENWLFPEVRDDRTETFRAFESALTQNEPSHENAVKAMQRYLDDLVDVSQISVMGMYEHTEETDKHDRNGKPTFLHTLYLVGRSPNPPYSFFWRKAIHFGEPGIRWTGWERIDQDLSGDHIIPFVFEGDFHIAWPLFKTNDKDDETYEIQMAWAKKTATGWAKRKTSRDTLPRPGMSPIEKFKKQDVRGMFAFRLNPANYRPAQDASVEIEILAKRRVLTIKPPEPPSSSLQWLNGVRKNTHKVFWSLDVSVENINAKYTDTARAEALAYIDYTIILTGVVQESLSDTLGPRVGRIDLISKLWEDTLATIDSYKKTLSDKDKTALDILLAASMAVISPALIVPTTALPLIFALESVLQATFPILAYQLHKLFFDPVFRITGNGQDKVKLPSSIGLVFTSDRMIAFSRTPGPRNIAIKATNSLGQDLDLKQDISSGVTSGESHLIKVDFLFTPEKDPKEPPEPELRMESIGSFRLISGLDEVVRTMNQGTLVPHPPSHYSFWCSGFKLPSGFWPFLRTAAEINFLIQGRIMADRSEQTWSAEAGIQRLLARIIVPDGDLIGLYPLGYSEASLYLQKSIVGLEKIFNLNAQIKGENPFFGIDSVSDLIGQSAIIDNLKRRQLLGFDLAMPNAGYNWEIFYHLPIAVATFLSRQHRFEEARRWFHFVFDPTTDNASTSRERFWRFLPFRTAQIPATINQLLEALANPSANPSTKEEVTQQVAAWLEDPFNPFAVARLRTGAFEWHTVVAYIKNLIAWADQLFRQDSRESIDEATLLYVLAANILGPRPEKIYARGNQRASLSYRALKNNNPDDLGNAWLTLADSPLIKAWIELLKMLAQRGINPQSAWEQIQQLEQLSSIGSLYFRVPPNEKLPELWELVEDRLFKIRHCQNIEGITRSLPLYEPPIDPELLIRAKAAGIDLADVLADRFAPLAHYRFQALLQRANPDCASTRNRCSR
jgi:hypothetical protein